jgi:hypothetical protein
VRKKGEDQRLELKRAGGGIRQCLRFEWVKKLRRSIYRLEYWWTTWKWQLLELKDTPFTKSPHHGSCIDTSPFQSVSATHKQDRALLNSNIIRNAMATAALSFLGLSVEVRLMIGQIRAC